MYIFVEDTGVGLRHGLCMTGLRSLFCGLGKDERAREPYVLNKLAVPIYNILA